MWNRHNSSLGNMRKLLVLFVIVTLMLSLSTGTITLPVKAGSTPQITLDPDWGWYDTTVRIHGTGFAANEEVIISWESLNHWRVFASTYSSGDFDVWFGVPDGLVAGDYVVSAVDGDGNTASDTFTLYYVYAGAGSFGIKTPKQYIQWKYDRDDFYCDSWKFYHDSYDNWYSLMYEDYGLYILRITYNGSTYVFDLGSRRLAGGRFNAWPEPLIEEVLGFEVKGVDHVQGTILLYDTTGSVLLLTTVVDICAPITAENYYAVLFTITAEAKLDDLAFYVAYNLDMYTDCPNWAYYENALDAVYQYYGPSYYWSDVPEKRKCYAGFGSIIPASTHHDAVVDYQYVQYVADHLIDYDFDYRDRGVAYGDYFGAWGRDCGVGLQWIVGSINVEDSATIPVTFAVSDETFDAFKASIRKGKLFAYQFLTPPPAITLDSSEGPGSSIVTASGEGFMPYAQVEVYFDGVLVGSFGANYTGAFEGSFTVPTSVTGVYNVTAVDEYGLEASVYFEVVELTLEWLLDRLDEFNATIITGLIRDVNGTLCAKIDTAVGTIVADISTINGRLATIEGRLATVETDIGAIKTDISNIRGRITRVEGSIVTIQTAIGAIQTDISNVVLMITFIEGNVATVMTDVGAIKLKLDETVIPFLQAIEAKLHFINATTLRIESAIGDVEVKIDDIGVFLGNIKAKIVDVEGKIDGAYLALNTTLGEVEVKLEYLNATLVAVHGGTAEILVRIGAPTSTIFAELSSIKASVREIQGDVATIETDIGTIQTDIDNINGEIVAVKGDMVTVRTSIEDVNVSLTDINAKITVTDGYIATIHTDVGTIKGNVTSIQREIVTIKTDIGTITTNTDLIKSHTGLQPTTTALVAIVIISVLVSTLLIQRKVFKRPPSMHEKDISEKSR